MSKELDEKLKYHIKGSNTSMILNGNGSFISDLVEIFDGKANMVSTESEGISLRKGRQWRFKKYGDYYKIVVSGGTSDGRLLTDMTKFGFNVACVSKSYDIQGLTLWKLAYEKEKVIIQNKSTGNFLKTNGLLGVGKEEDIEWEIVIAAYEWNFTQSHIEYEETSLPEGTNPVEILTNDRWNNNSPATVSQEVSSEIKRVSSFEWGLKQTVKVGSKITVKASVPFLASVEAEASFELGLEAHQSWATSNHLTYGFKRTIELPPYSAIVVNAYVDWVKDFGSNFTLYLWVTAAAAADAKHKLTAEQLEEALKGGGFNGKVEKKDEKDKLLISVKGRLVGSYGMNTSVDVQQIPLKKMDEAR